MEGISRASQLQGSNNTQIGTDCNEGSLRRVAQLGMIRFLRSEEDTTVAGGGLGADIVMESITPTIENLCRARLEKSGNLPSTRHQN